MRTYLPAALVLALIGACASITAQTGDGGSAGGLEVRQVDRYVDPGPEHDVLDAFRGRWAEQVEFHPEPDAPAQTAEFEIEYGWIMGGRYMQSRSSAWVNGRPYRGTQIFGFDAFREQYTWYQLDNMSTAPLSGRGTWDPEARRLTIEGTFDRIVENERDVPFRATWTFGDDGYVSEYRIPGPDGKMFVLLRGTGKRP